MPFYQIPSRLQYEIVRQVGEGSALVYQARTHEAGLPRTVALKATTYGRALHEARILASLQHPSIPLYWLLNLGNPFQQRASKMALSVPFPRHLHMRQVARRCSA
jgi:hypothetical protein